ncbi:MAG: peroxiredoxin family protein [Planctomycetaceae bacterium]
MRTMCLMALMSGICAAQEAEPDVSPRQLASAYERLWESFVSDFKDSTDTKVRLRLVERTSQSANKLLQPHLGSDTIRRVLPLMSNTKLLDLEPSFLGAAREQSEPRLKGLVLLHFAEYLGNNRRVEDCEVTLRHLQKKYGKLKFKSTTFSAAAEEALYYFKNLAIGCEAPPTTGRDADGQVFSLSDYNGKVVMLRFWGDWCPACRAMYPYERQITRRYRNRPFALIGVNSDPEQRCRTAQKKHSLTWRTFWDGGDVKGPIAHMYQVEDWPRIIIIDANGRIRMNSRGLDEDYVDALLDRLINEAEQQDVSE